MRSLLALALLLSPILTVAAPRPIPNLSGPVIDEAGILRTEEVQELSEKMQSFLPKMQMQIWIVTNLQDEPIENLSIRAVEKWKLGTAKEDNGLLLLISKEDHRARIEVGQGLEG